MTKLTRFVLALLLWLLPWIGAALGLGMAALIWHVAGDQDWWLPLAATACVGTPLAFYAIAYKTEPPKWMQKRTTEDSKGSSER